MTDRDKLILDVETDGSIDPREALASAGGTLLELVQPVQRAGARRRGRRRSARAEDERSCRASYAITIEELNLSVRSYNCLEARGHHTRSGDLVARSPSRS